MKESGSRDYERSVQADITVRTCPLVSVSPLTTPFSVVFAIRVQLLKETLTASVPSDVDCSNMTFEQGDACDLPASLGSFDAVLCSNLLCR
jgi:hypothetical protein